MLLIYFIFISIVGEICKIYGDQICLFSSTRNKQTLKFCFSKYFHNLKKKSYCLLIFCCLVTKLYPTPLQPHVLQPARLLCPWDSPGKNTGVGCHFPSPGDLPDPGIEPMSPVLTDGLFTTEPPGKLYHLLITMCIFLIHAFLIVFCL